MSVEGIEKRLVEGYRSSGEIKTGGKQGAVHQSVPAGTQAFGDPGGGDHIGHVGNRADPQVGTESHPCLRYVQAIASVGQSAVLVYSVAAEQVGTGRVFLQ